MIQNNLGGREGTAMLGTKRGRSRRLPTPPTPREVVSLHSDYNPTAKNLKGFSRWSKIYSWPLSLRRTTAPPRKLFWVLGCWVVACVKADYAPGAGGVGSPRLRPLFVPRIAVPSRPPRLFWIKSIYRPLAPLSSLPLSPPMMRRTHSFMVVLARLARECH